MTSSQNERLPSLPPWRLAEKDALAAKHYNQFFGRWVDERLTMMVINCIADDLVVDLGLGQDEHTMVIIDSFGPYQDQILTKELAVQFSLQMAWNLDDTWKRRRPLQKFSAVPQRCWLPFVIKGVEAVERFGKTMGRLDLLCIGGFAAGFPVSKVVPWNYLKYFAYQVGFNRRHPYDKPEHLLQLRFAGLVEASTTDDLDFTHYRANQAMKTKNKQLIQQRVPGEGDEEDF